MNKWLLAAIILIPTLAYSAGLRYTQVTPEMRDEGDSPLFINVSCPPLGNTNAWTTVASSDTIRRVLFVQSDYALQPPICLGTATVGGTTPACSSSFQGIIIGTAGVTSATIYTKNAWSCASATLATGILHGYIGRDKRDFGDVGAADLQ